MSTVRDRPITNEMDMIAEAKSEAERVLSEYWVFDRLPIDPVRIAQRMGVDVREANMPPQVSGSLVKKTDSDPVILVQRSDSENRKRFTCAHEIGHYIRRAGDSEIKYVDLREAMYQKGSDPEEVFANAFAASLLMPEGIVRRFHGEGIPLWQMAARFKVSAEAMRWRLVNLGLETDE